MDKHKSSLYVPLRFTFTPDSVLTALLASYTVQYRRFNVGETYAKERGVYYRT